MLGQFGNGFCFRYVLLINVKPFMFYFYGSKSTANPKQNFLLKFQCRKVHIQLTRIIHNSKPSLKYVATYNYPRSCGHLKKGNSTFKFARRYGRSFLWFLNFITQCLCTAWRALLQLVGHYYSLKGIITACRTLLQLEGHYYSL